MSNPDRYWESAIAEAASGRQPPDQTAEILARLNAPALRGWAARPWPVRVAIHAAQTALAAGVLLAIGLATGVVRWPGSGAGPPLEDGPVMHRELVAAPGTRWRDHESHIALEEGALLLATGSPEVRRGASSFAQLDGLALVCAHEPAPEQKTELQTWMQTKGVEEAMLKNATRWITGTALCVLMLQGSATLDGQKVEAEKPAEPVWHKVDSLMALDKLPTTARNIEISGKTGSYLPVLATIERIEGLRFLGGMNVMPEHLRALRAMPNLRVLQLYGTSWTEGPDYAPIAGIAKLEQVGLDLYLPQRRNEEPKAEIEKRELEVASRQIEAFRLLAAKGLKVDFKIGQNASPFIGALADVFPDCEELTVPGATNETFRDIAKFKNLRRATISEENAGEPAYAWLAKLEKLESLTLGARAFRAEYAYQLAKIKSLQRFTLYGLFQGHVYGGSLAMLGTMEQLRELRLRNYKCWEVLMNLDGQTESPLKALKNLDVFAIQAYEGFDADTPPKITHPFDLGFFVGPRMLEIRLDTHRFEGAAAPVADPLTGDAETPGRIECIRIILEHWEPKLIERGGTWAKSLQRYPNLKRIEIGMSGRFAQPRAAENSGKLIEEMRKAARPGIEIVEVEDK